MSAPRTTWRAKEPEAEARRVAGRPVQAFWPLLAPSFRWVLLPPHRHAADDEIEWEWRASPSPAKPGAADLNDLRARLRDSLDLLATDLRRRPALPDGLAAAALLDEFEQIFGSLRHAPDPVLAEHAVLTDLGWMLRSWGVSRPSPARAEKPAPSADASAAPPDTPAAPAAESVRRKRRLLVWALLAVAVAAAAWWRYRARETPPPNDAPAQATEKPEQIDATKIAAGSPPHDIGPAAYSKSQGGQKTTAPDARPLGPASSARGTTPLEAGASTPAALTGKMAAAPDALAPQAGPSSKVKGTTETPPGFAARRSDISNGAAPEAPSSDTPAGRPPNNAGAAPSGNEGPAPAPAKKVEPGPGKTDRGSTPAAPALPPPEPDAFTVEARAAPPPTPPPSSLNGRAAETRATEPRKTTEAESTQAGQAPPAATPPPASTAATKTAEEVITPPTGEDAQTTSGADQSAAAPAWDEPSRRLRLRAAPWRLMLERDIVLPSRPVEGTGEAEIRAARIAAWAQARALTPPAFRRKEILAGWTFTFDPGASAKGPLVWRTKSGAAAVQEIDAAGGRARLGWQDSDAGEMDTSLTDAAGAPLARVWRKPDENRLLVFTSATVREIRPWFALRLRKSDSGEGLQPPEGWTLENGKRQVLAEGPEGATRMRWTHAESGWVLHGGYTREAP